MGTEILLPQDCLNERIRVPPAYFYRRRGHYGNSNARTCNYGHGSNRKAVSRPERSDQRRSSVESSSDDDKKMVKSPVMEKVTILRRGEQLESKMKCEVVKKENDDLVVCGTNRSCQTPEMIPKQRGTVNLKSPVDGCCGTYAGPAFSMSPAPNSLPLPSFSKRKPVLAIVDDSATRDLRRLLRLDA